MVSVGVICAKIWKKYRVELLWIKYNIGRKHSSSRIKGLYKLAIKRAYAQYAEEAKLEESGVCYSDWNLRLMPTRFNRRVKQSMTVLGFLQ